LFNAGFEWASASYGKVTGRLIRASAIIGVVYLALIGLTGFQMSRMPSGFIPSQDIGYQAVIVFLPPGSSLQRTDAVVREVNDIILKEVPGPTHTSPVTGLDVTTSTIAPNVGTIFYGLPSLYGHHIPGVNAETMPHRVGRHQGCGGYRREPAPRPRTRFRRWLQANGRRSWRPYAPGTCRRHQYAGRGSQ
jgi:multidrug efflux pump subunit AcrB